MQITKDNTKPFILTIVSIVSCYLIIYLSTIVLSFGTLILSGLYFSIIMLSIGITGFLAFTFVRALKYKLNKYIDISLVIFVNLIAISIFEKFFKKSPGVEYVGQSTIVRHNVAEFTILSFYGFVLVSLISLLLLVLYYYYEKRFSDQRK